MMGVAKFVLGDECDHIALDGKRRRAEREAQAFGNAKDVRIHGESRVFEDDGHHDARGLAADARKRFERVAIARNLASVLR